MLKTRLAARCRYSKKPQVYRLVSGVHQICAHSNAAATGGAVVALITARLLFGRADLTLLLNGALAGLAAITAEPSTPTSLQAALFGGLGGVRVVFSMLSLDRIKIEDSVGAISVHGTCGLLGLLLVPLTNSDVTFVGQMVGALTIFVWVFAASTVVWLALKVTMDIRVSEEEEFLSVDVSECGVEGYPKFVKA